MRMNRPIALSAIAGAIVMCLPMARPAAQSPATPDQVVAALKQNLAESQKRLRQYEWIETTAISLKGEEKSRKQQRVYYGADGKLTKVPLGEPHLRRHLAEAGVAAGAQGARRREQEERDAGVHGEGRQPDPSVRPAQPRADPAGEGCRQRPAATAAGREGAHRAAKLRAALGPARHRRGREGQCNLYSAQRRDLSRERRTR